MLLVALSRIYSVQVHDKNLVRTESAELVKAGNPAQPAALPCWAACSIGWHQRTSAHRLQCNKLGRRPTRLRSGQPTIWPEKCAPLNTHGTFELW
jgi:hypothetical protein